MNISMSSLKLFLHLRIWPQCKLKFSTVSTLLFGKINGAVRLHKLLRSVDGWCSHSANECVCSHSMTHRWYQQGTENFNYMNSCSWVLYFYVMGLLNHLVSPLSLGLPSGFCTKILYEFLLSPLLTTCPIHLVLFHMITWPIFCEEYKQWSFSLCGLL